MGKRWSLLTVDGMNTFLIAVTSCFSPTGSIYGVYYQWEYVISNIGGFGIWTFPCFIAPHFAFVLGWISAYGVLLIALQDTGKYCFFPVIRFTMSSVKLLFYT